MLKRFLKNEKGLTLIELLAVVVILGIIAAIAVPAIGKIIDDSREKAVVSDALQIINAAKIAKAANPTVNDFEADGTKDPDDNVDLDNYLDTEVTAAEVSFDPDNNVWSISNHKVSNGAEAVADFEDPVEEKDLVGFLQGK